MTGPAVFYHKLNEKVLLLKLMPGMDGSVLERLFPFYDAVVIEAFGVGGLPEYGRVPFYTEIRRWTEAGKIVMMATQVTHEGSDMEVYKVGRVIKENFHLMEAYDMTLEATVAKVMWALGQEEQENPGPCGRSERFRRLFYKTVNHDMLLYAQGSEEDGGLRQ